MPEPQVDGLPDPGIPGDLDRDRPAVGHGDREPAELGSSSVYLNQGTALAQSLREGIGQPDGLGWLRCE